MATKVQGSVKKSDTGLHYTIEIDTDNITDAEAANELIRNPKNALSSITNKNGHRNENVPMPYGELGQIVKQARILQSFKASDGRDKEMVEIATAINKIGVRIEKLATEINNGDTDEC